MLWLIHMFDIKWVRDRPDAFDAGLARRGLAPQAAVLIELDGLRRGALAEAQSIQTERNRLSKEVGELKRRGANADDVLAEVARSKDRQAAAEDRARSAEANLDRALASLPNLPADDVPDGQDEGANVEIRRWGEPQDFDFQPKDHAAIGEDMGLMDFDRAAKLSGARFVVLTGALARMERALAAFMLDLHTTEFGYTEINPPALVRDDALFGTGQLPKFEDDLFCTFRTNPFLSPSADEDDAVAAACSGAGSGAEANAEGGAATDDLEGPERIGRRAIQAFRDRLAQQRLWLIPTAEVPLTNLMADEIVDEGSLPRRLAALTWCFRSEAGSAGRDTRGMIRQHQFSKVELVSITRPEDSEAEHERMTECAETVLQRLDLPYRTVVLSAGDMGFGATKTHDIEVWLPAQARYREISSCSNCGEFQARRMRARYRPAGEKGTRFCHTLNGSGLAVGRTLIAVLENHQRADGSVVIPEVLRPYMGGLEILIPRRDDIP